MRTEFYCEYELKDTTAIADSCPTTLSNSTFAEINKIKDGVNFPDYATLEEDFFILDGSMEEFPDNEEDIVFFTSEMSNENGRFSENPIITIAFTENHTSIGLTFHFVGDYPLEMRVTWKDLVDTTITTVTCGVDNNKFFLHNQVEDYGKLEIEFIRTKPYRYIKLCYLEYGKDIVFGKDGYKVKDASVVEEFDAISEKLSINKLSFKVIDEQDDFNVANPVGLHKVLQKGQALRAFETVDKECIFMGAYFLKTSSTVKNISSITCTDYMGILDNITFRRGAVYSETPAGEILESIFLAAGVKAYTIDPITYSKPINGWLKIQTCRKALREVLFATGSVADTTRSDRINIFRQDRIIKTEISRSRKFSTSIKTDDYISDVAIKFPTYILNTAVKEIMKGSYTAGTYTVDFSSPVKDLTISAGRILEQSTNYVSFSLDAPADIVISGKKYDKEDITVNTSVKNVAAGETRKEKSFTGTLLNAQAAQEVAGKILDYYSLRQILNIKFLSRRDAVAHWAEIGNPISRHGNFVAGFEKMTTDLTGGFTATAELRGYYKLLTDFYYAEEFYLNEDVGGM